MDNKSVTINKEIIEEILLDLNNVLLTCDNLGHREKIQKIITTLEESTSRDKVSIDDLIVNKMNETRGNDDDLHFKLYMLHRKLQDGKISEEQAKAVYKNYYSL